MAVLFQQPRYAWFVWPSYLACVLILLWLAVSPYRRHRRTIEKLKQSPSRR